jgi:hypothetical protein
MSAGGQIAEALGFPPPLETKGLRSIAHHFPVSRPRCGIYLLELPGGVYYVGQANDVVRRFAQHAKAHECIESVAFIPTRQKDLDYREKELIFAAECAGVTLTNVMHVTDVAGEADLEALVPLVQQQEWLLAPAETNRRDHATQPIALPDAHLARFAQKMARLERHKLGRATFLQLYLYLESCIPFPRLTEYSFWSVSCMPATGASRRLACLSAGAMELFCLGDFGEPDLVDEGWGFVNVASDLLLAEFKSIKGFSRAYPQVELRPTNYRDGGQHQVGLVAYSQGVMVELLLDERVCRAAATLALRVMRKRPTLYFKYHCPQLVDRALQLRERASDQLAVEVKAVMRQAGMGERRS